MKLSRLFLAMILIVFMALTFAAPVKSQETYLKNTTNSAVTDTIATASANDTSFIFKNIGYANIWVQAKQNSIYQQYKLESVTSSMQIRVIYNAADSSLYTQEKGLLGWYPVPILIPSSSTQTDKFPLTAKTGVGIITCAIKE